MEVPFKTNISKFQFDQESGRWRTTKWMSPHLTSPLRASWHVRPSQAPHPPFPPPRLSHLAVTVFTSSHDRHPASALTFSTVCLQLVFGAVYIHSSFQSSSILRPVRHGWPYQKPKTPAYIALWVIETQITPPQ